MLVSAEKPKLTIEIKIGIKDLNINSLTTESTEEINNRSNMKVC